VHYCAGETLCEKVLAGRMPHRKHFALAVTKNSFSPRQTTVLSRFLLFTIFTGPLPAAARRNSAVEFWPGCANCGVLASREKLAIVERKRQFGIGHMLKVKDTLRATVHLSFDGRVCKAYHGPKAHARFANEVRVLRHLEARGCNFVPRLLEADEPGLSIVTTNCGTRVEHIDDERAKLLFAELEKFGVRHDDPDKRNITYRNSDGRFCLIDFEFATILPETSQP
jgi:hypothetical protein